MRPKTWDNDFSKKRPKSIISIKQGQKLSLKNVSQCFITSAFLENFSKIMLHKSDISKAKEKYF